MTTKNTVKATNLKEIRYDFTEVQLESLRPVLAEYRALQRQINFFLSHVAREAKLPKPIAPYELKFEDVTGEPYMSGQVAEEVKPDGR